MDGTILSSGAVVGDNLIVDYNPDDPAWPSFENMQYALNSSPITRQELRLSRVAPVGRNPAYDDTPLPVRDYPPGLGVIKSPHEWNPSTQEFAFRVIDGKRVWDQLIPYSNLTKSERGHRILIANRVMATSFFRKKMELRSFADIVWMMKDLSKTQPYYFSPRQLKRRWWPDNLSFGNFAQAAFRYRPLGSREGPGKVPPVPPPPPHVDPPRHGDADQPPVPPLGGGIEGSGPHGGGHSGDPVKPWAPPGHGDDPPPKRPKPNPEDSAQNAELAAVIDRKIDHLIDVQRRSFGLLLQMKINSDDTYDTLMRTYMLKEIAGLRTGEITDADLNQMEAGMQQQYFERIKTLQKRVTLEGERSSDVADVIIAPINAVGNIAKGAGDAIGGVGRTVLGFGKLVGSAVDIANMRQSVMDNAHKVMDDLEKVEEEVDTIEKKGEKAWNTVKGWFSKPKKHKHKSIRDLQLAANRKAIAEGKPLPYPNVNDDPPTPQPVTIAEPAPVYGVNPASDPFGYALMGEGGNVGVLRRRDPRPGGAPVPAAYQKIWDDIWYLVIKGMNINVDVTKLSSADRMILPYGYEYVDGPYRGQDVYGNPTVQFTQPGPHWHLTTNRHSMNWSKITKPLRPVGPEIKSGDSGDAVPAPGGAAGAGGGGGADGFDPSDQPDTSLHPGDPATDGFGVLSETTPVAFVNHLIGGGTRPERKHFDTEYGFEGEELEGIPFESSGRVFLCNGITRQPVSADYTHRTGSKVSLLSLEVKGKVFYNIGGNPAIPKDYPSQRVRMLVVHDRHPRGRLPSFDSVLTDPSAYAFKREDGYHRYKILIDKEFSFGQYKEGSYFGDKTEYNVDLYKKIDAEATFRGPEGTATAEPEPQGDIATGGLFIMFMGEFLQADDQQVPFFKGRVRVRFIDK